MGKIARSFGSSLLSVIHALTALRLQWHAAVLILTLGFASAMPTAHANDCSLAGWSQQGTVAVGGPPTMPRYSGRCSIQVSSPQSYVHVTHPNAEPTYYARFYYYTGVRSAGTADIFQGRDGALLPIRVEHEVGGSNLLRFSTAGSAVQRTAAVQPNAWYAVELAWTAGAGNGALGITVTGAGISTPMSLSPIDGLNNASQRIREIRMGWITAGGSGAVHFDAFEARRDGPPGRLCRGDANGDGAIGADDRILITNEMLGLDLAPGQPDANEDGAVGSADRITVTNMILASASCDDV